MEWLRAIGGDVGPIVWGDRLWLTWNTMLALFPAVLAVPLFRSRGRWGPVRLLGLVLFVLFLPNAPYVVTDLVHLHGDVAQADTDAAVYAGILPVYAAFIGVGFACYAVGVGELGRWLRRTGRAHLVGPVEVVVHAASAVGVLLGRVARLNSWDTITQPHGTIERTLDTLRWQGSTSALVVLFVVIWVGHAVTRATGVAAAALVGRLLPGRLPASG